MGNFFHCLLSSFYYFINYFCHGKTVKIKARDATRNCLCSRQKFSHWKFHKGRSLQAVRRVLPQQAQQWADLYQFTPKGVSHFTFGCKPLTVFNLVVFSLKTRSILSELTLAPRCSDYLPWASRLIWWRCRTVLRAAEISQVFTVCSFFFLSCSFQWRATRQSLFCQCISARGSVC